MSHAQPRPIVDGAMLAAVATLLVLGALYIPLLGSFLSFVWPIPVVLAYMRHGGKLAVLCLTVIAFLVALIAGLLQSALLVLSSGLLALVFGYCISRKIAAEQTVLVGGVVSLLSVLAGFQLSRWFLGIDVLEELERLIRQSLQMAAGFPGMAGSNRQQVEDMLAQLPDLLQTLLPSMLLLAGIFFSYVSYAVTKLVLMRLKMDAPPLPAFRDWQLPRWSLLGLLASFLLLWAYRSNPLPWYQVTGYNLQFVFQIIFLIQGSALGYYLLMRWNMRPAVAAVLLIFLALNPFTAQLLFWAGIMESVLHYRRMIEKEDEQRLTVRPESHDTLGEEEEDAWEEPTFTARKKPDEDKEEHR